MRGGQPGARGDQPILWLAAPRGASNSGFVETVRFRFRAPERGHGAAFREAGPGKRGLARHNSLSLHNEKMIRVENLSKRYGKKQALNGLSFRVAEGEIIGLVGKNGAGKSTALKILSAQMLPSGGEAFIAGISVAAFPELVRARIGFLPEVAPLYREMSVFRYLDFAARLRQVAAAQVAGRIDAVVAETGLAEVRGERLGTLSRGFQQRVGIAQAMVHRPPVILLDEPMAGLDPLQIVQIRDLIVSLRGRHTVLFSSHILSEITNVCDRVVLIDQGEVKAEGTETELRRGLAAAGRLVLVVKGTSKLLEQVVEGIAGLSLDHIATEEKGRVRAILTARGDLREALAKACVGAGLGLLELKAEQGGLEELFLQVLGAGPGSEGDAGGSGVRAAAPGETPRADEGSGAAS